MSNPPQDSMNNSEINFSKIKFNPNASHFIWFSPLSQNTDLTEKYEKTSTVINDLEEEIEENFNLEKFEDLKICGTSKSIVQGIKPPSKNDKDKWRLTKIKFSAIQTFKSKSVNFTKRSRFAGIPLAMSK